MFRKIVLPMLIMCVIGVWLLLLCGMKLGNIFDFPTLIPVIITPYILATIGFGAKRSSLAFSAPFSAGAGVADQKSAIAYFNSVLAYMIGFSVLLLMTGFIGMLHGIPYPSEASVVGTNVSIALLSIFYGASGSLLLVLPFRTAAVSRLAELEAE